MLRFIVITPSYNRSQELKRCLDSLLAQTYKHWQVIVVNDGSSADYSSLEPYWQNAQVRYLAQTENRGVNQARNIALEQAPAEVTDYLCFVDDDEYLVPEAFAIAHAVLTKNPQAWLVLQCFLNHNNRTYMARSGPMDYIDDYLYGKSLKKDATHFIRADVAKLARFSNFVRNGEEWVYFATIAKHTACWAEPIPVKYNLHQPQGLFLGNMHGKSILKPYLMKWYRPYVAVKLRPHNAKAWQALILQTLKLPLRLPQMSYKLIKNAFSA